MPSSIHAQLAAVRARLRDAEALISCLAQRMSEPQWDAAVEQWEAICAERDASTGALPSAPPCILLDPRQHEAPGPDQRPEGS